MAELETLTMSPLRISTTVTTCHAGCGIRLKNLFDKFSKWSIPFGYPGEGFLKMEYENKVVGYSTRDVLTKRKLTEKTFFNQATLVIRKTLAGRGWKEVNIKLFANGGIQMTGVPTPEFSQEAIKYVIDEIKKKDAEIFTGTLAQVRTWLQGVEWSRNYDELHKISNDDKRMAAEQKERNRQLMRTLKEGKRVEGIEK